MMEYDYSYPIPSKNLSTSLDIFSGTFSKHSWNNFNVSFISSIMIYLSHKVTKDI